jgi:hypothetical protein
MLKQFIVHRRVNLVSPVTLFSGGTSFGPAAGDAECDPFAVKGGSPNWDL